MRLSPNGPHNDDYTELKAARAAAGGLMSIPYETCTAKDEPVTDGATPGRLMLTPAAILARAAEVIERNGLAHGTYDRRQHGLNAQNAPVCTLGAIAVAVGAEPYAWEDADLWKRELAAAAIAVNALLHFLGFDPEETHNDTLGSWNDAHSAVAVVHELRAAAREATRLELKTKPEGVRTTRLMPGNPASTERDRPQKQGR
jgi:hypothetical protein